MSDEKNSQIANVVQGDQAGRDIVTNVNHYTYDPSRPTQMSRLIDKFKAEHATNSQYQQTIDKLEHFGTVVAEEQVIGLEQKLTAGGRTSFLEFAQRTKELFTKKLAKHQFSESAQRIHALLLAEVYSRFHNHVYPRIVAGGAEAEINLLVQSQIIDPVQAMLEENVLHLYADEINGMLYFLTGNCHIKWAK